MTRTLLAELIDKQVAQSVIKTLSRATDDIAEDLAHDILRDPTFRAEIQALIRVAFQRTLTDLTTENKQ